MTGPRHLWSGDWERESVGTDATYKQPQPEQTPQQEPEHDPDHDPRNGRRPNRTVVAAIVVGGLAIAGLAVGLTAAFDNGSSNPTTTASTTRSTITRTPGTQSNPNNNYGGGYGLSPTVPQTGSTTQTTPQTQIPTQTQTQTQTIPDLPGINWLGMQIITGPTGPVVTTMSLAGAGNAAGFEPDDIITAVNGHSVSTAVDLGKLLDKLPIGSTVQLEVVRGSSQITMAVTMKERPTVQP
jgi:hypothetical protein